MKTSKFFSPILAASAIIGLMLTAGTAVASEPELYPPKEEWVKTATIKFDGTDVPTFSPKSADASTWGPGGIGATVSVKVNGSGLHVKTAAVNYNVGGNLSNACTDSFEVAYWQSGVRKTQQTTKGHCTPWRVSHTFQVNKNMDHNSKFCGSVVVGGSRSGYACVTIKK